MKNIKDITLSAFAVIGFYSIITAFTSTESNPAQQVINGTPESHVWEFHLAPPSGGGNGSATAKAGLAFSINKVTGEVRQHQSRFTNLATKDGKKQFATYRVSSAR